MKAELIQPQVKPDVVLTMTWEEAETLSAICDLVGGNPETSRRGHTDALNRALRRQGINVEPEDIDVNGPGVSFLSITVNK